MLFSTAQESTTLSYEFMDACQKLRFKTPNTDLSERYYITGGVFSVSIEEFLKLTTYMEALFFKEYKDINTYNTILYRSPSTMKRNIESIKNYATGFILYNAKKDEYVENPNARHLEGAEKLLKKDNNHFIRIYTVDNTFIVWTNTHMSLQTVAKLKLLQWEIFKDTIEVTHPEIIEFIKAIVDKDTNKLNETIETLFNSEDVQAYTIERLNKAFSANYEHQIKNIKGAIITKNKVFIEKENNLARLLSEIRELQEQLENLEIQKNKKQDHTTLIKHLMKNPYIKEIEAVGDRTIDLWYEAPIIYFDDFIAEKILLSYISPEKRKIIKAIIDQEYELMTRCRIRFNTQYFSIEAIQIGNDGLLGHPHLDRYQCRGTHDRYIYEAAKTANYIGAIEQITAAVLNLNFADSIVIDTMLGTLTDNHYFERLKTWRHKKTKVMITTKELMEVIQDEETQTNS